MDIVTFVWYHHVQEKKRMLAALLPPGTNEKSAVSCSKRKPEMYQIQLHIISLFLSPSSLTINHENTFN
jgi:hypothetical protein